MAEDRIHDQDVSRNPGDGRVFGTGEVFHPVFNNPSKQEASMNQEQTKGTFDQFKGKLKETWGRLTDDEIALYNGKRDQFFGKLEEKYGLAKEEAEDRLKEIERSANYRSDKAA